MEEIMTKAEWLLKLKKVIKLANEYNLKWQETYLTSAHRPHRILDIALDEQNIGTLEGDEEDGGWFTSIEVYKFLRLRFNSYIPTFDYKGYHKSQYRVKTGHHSYNPLFVSNNTEGVKALILYIQSKMKGLRKEAEAVGTLHLIELEKFRQANGTKA